MTRALSLFSSAFILLMSGCASSPDKIQATYVSPLKYESYSCEQVAMEMGYVEERTTRLYTQLKKEADADSAQMAVGMILFWPALFALEGGDGPEAAEYAQLKGEYEALRKQSVKKECGIDSRSPEEIIEAAKEEAKAEQSAEAEESRAW